MSSDTADKFEEEFYSRFTTASPYYLEGDDYKVEIHEEGAGGRKRGFVRFDGEAVVIDGQAEYSISKAVDEAIRVFDLK